MKERLFLNRVEMYRTGIPIDQAIIFSIAIFPYPADPSLSLGNAATVRT
jgi:hypothetical protein